MEYFTGKVINAEGAQYTITETDAQRIWSYLDSNDYIDADSNVTDKYRSDAANGTLQPLPAKLEHIPAAGIHTYVQAIFDSSVLDGMIENGKQTQVENNDLNDNFYRKEFQELWNCINHKYAYTVKFDSAELIEKAVNHIEDKLFVSELRYTVSVGEQHKDMKHDEVKSGTSFETAQTATRDLKHSEVSSVKYDLIGKIAEGTVLTRRTVAAILQKLSLKKYAMFTANPEEFISKVIRLIKEQKATMIVDCISYNQLDGSYDSEIFTAGMQNKNFDQAFRAQKSIQDFVFTDGTAEESIERKFVKELDTAAEVCVYAKLPKGFHIPTPVGNYSPDWAIAFNEGAVKHIFFVAETKGTMETLELRPIERAKISCARKLFNEMSTSQVKYHDVDSYKSLLDVMNSL